MSRALKSEKAQVFEIPLIEQPAYDVQDVLGKGGNAIVYAALRKGTGQRVPSGTEAVKVISLQATKRREGSREIFASYSFPSIVEADEGLGEIDGIPEKQKEGFVDKKYRLVQTELQIWQRLSGSQYVPHLHEFFQVQSTKGPEVCIVMERLTMTLEDVRNAFRKLWKCENQSMVLRKLSDRNQEVALDMKSIAVLMYKLLAALSFLKSHGIIHGDIKPSNVMLSMNGEVKLCDFGHAYRLPASRNYGIVQIVRGTKEYMAPELTQKGLKFSYAVDVWAAGVVLYGLFDKSAVTPIKGVSGKRHFKPNLWKAWAKSDSSYFLQFLGSSFLSTEEHRAELQLCKEYVNYSDPKVKELVDIRVASDADERTRIMPVAQIVRKCLIPHPINGPKGDIQRKGMVERISVENFQAWTSTYLEETNETALLNRVQRILQAVLTIEQNCNLQE